MSGECDRCGEQHLDCECAPFKWSDDPVKDAMLYFWGDRCPDFEPDCSCCQAWAKYDALTGLVARPQGAPRAAVLVFPTIMNPAAAVLVEHMRKIIREWERDEPRDDWWRYQHDYAQAADRIESLSAEVERLRGALRSARQIIAQIDEYMKRPDRGDWGVECACCMGELLDDDREAIARIDAALAGDSHDHR